MVILGQVFPYEFLRNAYRAAEALVIQQEIISNPVEANLYQPARTDALGVTTHDPKRVSPGYTLYTSGDDQVARLMDMDGRIVHQWRRPFSDIWNSRSSVREPQPDSLVYMDKATVLPNGDLLAIYVSSGDTPWGYGLVKLDKNSNLIWSYLAHVHHDLAVAPDSRIFTLTHQLNFDRSGMPPQIDSPYLEDFLVVLSADGKELEKISLTKAILRSRYGMLFEILPYFSLADPLHPNAVEYIDAEKARNFPFGEEGDVLLSFRDISLIAVLSMKTGEFTWAARGPWLRQHDPSILPNGEILLFDNFGGLRPYNSARVLQFDPRTSITTWSYAGSPDRPFHSAIRSNAQRLPNGNTLVTESDGGRLFEITSSGEIVWEFVIPLRHGERKDLIPIVNAGKRIDPEMLASEFRLEIEKQKASH